MLPFGQERIANAKVLRLEEVRSIIPEDHQDETSLSGLKQVSTCSSHFYTSPGSHLVIT